MIGGLASWVSPARCCTSACIGCFSVRLWTCVEVLAALDLRGASARETGGGSKFLLLRLPMIDVREVAIRRVASATLHGMLLVRKNRSRCFLVEVPFAPGVSTVSWVSCGSSVELPAALVT